MRAVFAGFTAILFGAVLITFHPRLIEGTAVVDDTPDTVSIERDAQESILPVSLNATSTLFFVGDIMLGRAVESQMERLGISYPFSEVAEILSTPQVTIGNFEGVVSEKHFPTAPYTFQFSIKSAYLTHLKDVGFDVLSLANNHTYDYGSSGLAYTRAQCDVYGLVCGGEPKGLSDFSTRVVNAGTQRIGIIFIHTLYGVPDSVTLQSYIDKMSTESDIQIAFVHWGDEYMLTHNPFQQKFAQELIDNGIDAVIGHHPHVVQEVTLYNGKPIFFSLGNFVFDQFFSDDVQTMLGIHMDITDSQIIYSLVPFTSIDSHSQPRHMEADNASNLFNRVLQGITEDDRVDIAQGTITIAR